jgi:hypothetical protein
MSSDAKSKPLEPGLPPRPDDPEAMDGEVEDAVMIDKGLKREKICVVVVSKGNGTRDD